MSETTSVLLWLSVVKLFGQQRETELRRLTDFEKGQDKVSFSTRFMDLLYSSSRALKRMITTAVFDDSILKAVIAYSPEKGIDFHATHISRYD